MAKKLEWLQTTTTTLNIIIGVSERKFFNNLRLNGSLIFLMFVNTNTTTTKQTTRHMLLISEFKLHIHNIELWRMLFCAFCNFCNVVLSTTKKFYLLFIVGSAKLFFFTKNTLVYIQFLIIRKEKNKRKSKQNNKASKNMCINVLFIVQLHIWSYRNTGCYGTFSRLFDKNKASTLSKHNLSSSK